MTVDFNDYFWGEKSDGFNVLYHNMKYGLVASKELSDYLRERSNIEETNSKLVTKLANKAGNGCLQGSFAPVWLVLKTSAERLSTLHLQMVQKITELVKDVGKYAEELQKKHKTVKDEEAGTFKIVQSMQATTQTLQKAKDLYMSKASELERLRKDSASPKELEKAEAKLKKLQEDYKILIDKYTPVKEEFERKMTTTCRHFQDIEEAHLKQMKQFLTTYAELLQSNHDLMGQVYSEFKRHCVEMTVDKLLEQFVLQKYTGLEKPGMMELEEFNFNLSNTTSVSVPTSESEKDRSGTSNGIPSDSVLGNKPFKKEGRVASKEADSRGCSAPSSPNGPDTSTFDSTQNSMSHSVLRGSKWFLRSRRDKAKTKKAKKKKDSDSSTNMEENADIEEKDDSPKNPITSPEVDEDGFCIRPKLENWENDKGSFYSSSDSDSDDDHERKLHVEIKPLTNGAGPMSASVDELRATVENLSLSSIGALTGSRGSNSDDSNIKRSQSVSQQIGSSQHKGTEDLSGLGLGLYSSPLSGANESAGGSTGSTPTSAPPSHPYAPLQSPTTANVHSPIFTGGSVSHRYADLGDIFSEVGDINPVIPGKPGRQMTSTPTSGISTSSIVIPRPPSRRSEQPPSRVLVSPAPSTTMSRADSLSSVGGAEFRTGFGSSRGPSPLTIGMADTIPLAVAFHEIVHAYFRGTDETRCQVKMSGDMMLSFPSGIVSVLANNPSPAKLAFRIRNSQKLDNIIPNAQLVSIDASQSTSDSTLLEFNMNALTALLRRQSDQNPVASYFNVDILKYQIKAKPGAVSCPFQLVGYWKCEASHTDLKIDYKYNSHAMSSPTPLLNVTVSVPVDGGVKNVQSMPASQWVADNNRCVWKFTELSQHSVNHGVGSLRARLEVAAGPSSLATISTQFNCEGTTLSGIEFELVGTGYRLSLVKRRFVSGKYICDGDRHLPNSASSSPPLSMDLPNIGEIH